MILTAALDAHLALPLYRQLYLRFRQALDQGRLRPGDRVPAVRALAAELNVARGTVEAAYQQLIAEGFLISRGPAGTFVSPQWNRSAPSGAITSPPAPVEAIHAGGPPLPLQLGLPALDAFPRKLWTRLAARQLRGAGLEGLVYPAARGHAGLRAAIATYLGLARGIACSPEQVFVCAGYRAGLDLIVQTLLAPGDACWFEEPGYFIARRALQAAGLALIPVPVDGEGLDVAAGLAQAPHARCALVTPSHQSPLGVSLSLHRRLALLDWAQREDAWIIEDDYDSEYRYQGKPLPALKSLDEQGRVLYAGTFSKVLFPGLRLAYLVVPPAQVAAFAASADRLHNHAPLLLQATVTSFLSEGHFARHLNRMRTLYRQRRQWLAEALATALGAGVRIELQAGGLHLLARLAQGDDQAWADAAQAEGLAAQALSRWYLAEPEQRGLLVGFTNVASNDEALALARRLAQLKP
ncbi:PLP-dependent aminotransferase family protein [Pseudomonas rhizoryzae]|uniref:MocR-like pyridoxine biosynthesis transcription factor PdxR n=1 Tax=Pseudomonas rhizoryzae TaxID=2571129 RepID=UPI0007361702|nr:PLP-dependent aminotransferase family protein [Pseudomonas rhizoryzae]KTT29556.1 DNA-binding protein [Pseudomonas psychrotolerans]KTT70646.1 DNA-binding protein [Pseudomonas psychrotolerans]